jgi:cyclopropane fatty-acyl-phospholipid synthase-like methyltransferase
MSADSYIHGTDPAEQDRLGALNRMTNLAFIDFLAVPAGARVLDVGSGLGLLASGVAEAAGEVRVWGVERSAEQIAAAVRHPRAATFEATPTISTSPTRPSNWRTRVMCWSTSRIPCRSSARCAG